LQALLRAAEERASERDARLAERDAVIEREEERIVRLEKLVADFKRAMFGSKSEKADPDQYQLAAGGHRDGNCNSACGRRGD
jgi:transposase